MTMLKNLFLAVIFIIVVAVVISKIPGAEQMISYHGSTTP